MPPLGIVTCTAELPSVADAVGEMDANTLESFGICTPSRTSSRNPKSTTSRAKKQPSWKQSSSSVSFGFDVLSIRSKYWCPPQNPLVVNVQPARLDLQPSAVDSQLLALLMSPFCRAISAAVIRPATSAATDEGDSPLCSSQRSVVMGPAVWMWFAVILIFW